MRKFFIGFEVLALVPAQWVPRATAECQIRPSPVLSGPLPASIHELDSAPHSKAHWKNNHPGTCHR